jgi:uncharacterized iron-regulated membrane protein
MMSGNSIRTVQALHSWSSLICTGFLLVICLTGLPLIFADEIDHLLDRSSFALVPANAPRQSLDRLAARTRAMYPGQVVTSMFADDDEPQDFVSMAPSFAAVAADPRVEHFVRFDSHSGAILERSPPLGQRGHSFMEVMLSLHTDLFAGLPGALFLGAMGLSFVVAVVTGVVLYGPFTRKLEFGEVRVAHSRRTRWLDLHNLLGVVTMAWIAVVGATGVMNELATPLFAIWQNTEVRAMLAPWQGKSAPAPDELSSPEAALDTAARALPGMIVSSIVFPGAGGGSPHHYLLWAHGRTPLTSRLFSPVLVDARSGQLTAVVRMPWYLRALEISRPLHFGDYGGLPLKMLWALLDLVTIVVLGSGLYLWLTKRRRVPSGATGFAVLEAAE